MDPAPAQGDSAVLAAESRWLRWSIAFVWLATGLLVVFPYYREVGETYLARLGLPGALMYLTCAFEVALGLWVAPRPASTWVTALQAALILGFTAILAVAAPELFVHPLGMVAKNLPLLAVIGAAWLIAREGWTGRVEWLLRVGLAAIWLIEGLSKLLFPQPLATELVTGSGLVPGDPALFLTLLGVLQIAAGLGTLLLRGRPLQWLLGAQIAALILLPLLITAQDWRWWVHPFGPLTKNAPIAVDSLVLARHARVLRH